MAKNLSKVLSLQRLLFMDFGGHPLNTPQDNAKVHI